MREHEADRTRTVWMRLGSPFVVLEPGVEFTLAAEMVKTEKAGQYDPIVAFRPERICISDSTMQHIEIHKVSVGGRVVRVSAPARCDPHAPNLWVVTIHDLWTIGPGDAITLSGVVTGVDTLRPQVSVTGTGRRGDAAP